jgi:hypothetical protein
MMPQAEEVSQREDADEIGLFAKWCMSVRLHFVLV